MQLYADFFFALHINVIKKHSYQLKKVKPSLDQVVEPWNANLFDLQQLCLNLIYKVPCPSVRPWRSSGPSQTDDRARPDKTGSRSCPAALLRGEDPIFAGPGPGTPGVRCVRVCACRGLETQVLRAEYWGPETRDLETQCPFIEALKLRSWEPNAATRQQQKKGAVSVCLSPETQLSRLLIGLAWLLKLGFLGRYQYIKNLLKKRRRGY
jgi:hypothetical protein